MRRQRPKYNKSQSEMTFPLTRDPDSPPKFKKHKLFAGVSFASRCQLRLQASENWKLLRQRKASLAAKDEQDREGGGGAEDQRLKTTGGACSWKFKLQNGLYRWAVTSPSIR